MRAITRRSTVGFVAAAAAAVLVSGVAGIGASAAGGQSGVEIEQLQAELSPTEATAGEEITVRSIGYGCVHGSGNRAGLVWAVFPRGDFVWGEQLGWAPEDAVASGVGNLSDVGGWAGAWTAIFTAPDLGEDPPTGGEIGPGSPMTSSVLPVYGPLPFTVDGHELDFVAKCQTHPEGTGYLTISPEVPELGGSATVTPDRPCPMPHTQGGSVTVELWSAPADEGAPISIDITDLDPVPVASDGSWSTTFHVPDDPHRRYAIATKCTNVEGGLTLGYLLEPFDVREPSSPPIETPPDFWDHASVPPGSAMPSDTVTPMAAPGQPVRATPTYTG
jgi:hypothetical protein